ncbi:MAG: hypothetical protein QW104_05960 [Nitrososphaerota archaeon]
MSDTGLMLIFFVFLAVFYTCVAFFYLKIRTTKAISNTSRRVPAGHMFSQTERITHDDFHQHIFRDDNGVVVQASNLTKVVPKTEPSLQPQQMQLTKSEGDINPQEGTDEVEKIVELIESSVKDVQMSKGAEGVSDEEVDNTSPDQTKILDNYGKLDYHGVSEDFVKSLKDLRYAIDELKKRISSDATS